jgi:hypothetical protein
MTFTYKDVTSYKYQLTSPYEYDLPTMPWPMVITPYVSILRGTLRLEIGYAWDGPSGPTIDTTSFMRGSLVHDALYQLIRLGYLDRNIYKPVADKILQAMCLADGMWPVRAWYVYQAVRLFGKLSTLPNSKESLENW